MTENIFKRLEQERATDIDSRVLIIDGLNLFLRIWASVPMISENGEHVGGIVGFLRSLGVCIREFNPSRCIVVFDGKGGSVRRRKLFPNYKANRTGKHNIRREEFNSAEDERLSMKNQLIRTVQYLNSLPVQIHSIDNIEADDVIAYIASNCYEKTENKIRIVSTDRDFLQLVSDRVEVYSPVKRKLYTPVEIEEEFGLHRDNYLIYRVLTGDTSDNIDGVRGLGLKTFLKYFPEASKEKVDIEYLLSFSKTRLNEDKKPKVVYKNIADSENIIRRNLDLMQLEDVDISGHAKMQVLDALRGSVNKFNRSEVKKMMGQDSLLGTFRDLDNWLLTTFNSLSVWSN